MINFMSGSKAKDSGTSIFGIILKEIVGECMYFKNKIRLFIFDSQSVKNTDTEKERR